MKVSSAVCFGLGLFLTVSGFGASRVHGGEIRSENPKEARYIRSSDSGDGHIRFELCPKASSAACTTLGDPRGYTAKQLGTKALRLNVNSVLTGLGDFVGGAVVTAVSLATGGVFLPSVAEFVLLAGVASPFAASKFGPDALNPKLKWKTAKTLRAGKKGAVIRVDGSIDQLAKRLDKALRQMPYDPADSRVTRDSHKQDSTEGWLAAGNGKSLTEVAVGAK